MITLQLTSLFIHVHLRWLMCYYATVEKIKRLLCLLRLKMNVILFSRMRKWKWVLMFYMVIFLKIRDKLQWKVSSCICKINIMVVVVVVIHSTIFLIIRFLILFLLLFLLLLLLLLLLFSFFFFFKCIKLYTCIKEAERRRRRRRSLNFFHLGAFDNEF